MMVQEKLKAAIAIMDEKGVQSHKTSDMALQIGDWNELREILAQCLESILAPQGHVYIANIGQAEVARWYKERHGEPSND